MTDPLKPSLSLLSKLGSIVVHADEATEVKWQSLVSERGHAFDVAAIRALLADTEVRQWIKDMGVYLPVKRGKR